MYEREQSDGDHVFWPSCYGGSLPVFRIWPFAHGFDLEDPTLVLSGYLARPVRNLMLPIPNMSLDCTGTFPYFTLFAATREFVHVHAILLVLPDCDKCGYSHAYRHSWQILWVLKNLKLALQGGVLAGNKAGVAFKELKVLGVTVLGGTVPLHV
ncbi:hypothetical protein P8C59_008418 [Phyllachora maydis]|uniref:Uncharacterized protein n=1 Tax=Phyllachora maydis TaxID=1825666 RepID=A0AAD9IAH6_9PEZI|nr:hypothetical protein P8C59_008418 [Phyllachora maydis]